MNGTTVPYLVNRIADQQVEIMREVNALAVFLFVLAGLFVAAVLGTLIRCLLVGWRRFGGRGR